MTMQRVIRKRVGELLMESGILNQQQLDEALAKQKAKGGLIGEVLVSMGLVTEEEIASCLSIQYGIPFLSLETYELDEKILALIPKNLILRHRVLPLDQMGKVITVAVANPLDEQALKEIEEKTGAQIQYFICTTSDLKKVIDKYFPNHDNITR